MFKEDWDRAFVGNGGIECREMEGGGGGEETDAWV